MPESFKMRTKKMNNLSGKIGTVNIEKYCNYLDGNFRDVETNSEAGKINWRQKLALVRGLKT